MSNGFFRRALQTGDEPLTLGTFSLFLCRLEIKSFISIGQMGIAGGLAGSVMALFNCPIELLKVKLQVQDPSGVIVNGKLEPPVSNPPRMPLNYILMLVY